MNFVKKILASAAVAAAVFLGPASADGWVNVQPGFNVTEQHATVRVEGSKPLAKRVDLYGWADVDATKEHPFTLKDVYGEVRLSYDLGGRIGAAAEWNGGTTAHDTVRFGFTAKPDLGKGNFTLVKVLPWDTAGHGPQFSVFTSQELTDRLSVDAVVDYNTDSETLFYEGRLSYDLDDRTAVFVKGSRFGSVHGNLEPDIIAGAKCSF